jgi:hypothetical protein
MKLLIRAFLLVALFTAAFSATVWAQCGSSSVWKRDYFDSCIYSTFCSGSPCQLDWCYGGPGCGGPQSCDFCTIPQECGFFTCCQGSVCA